MGFFSRLFGKPAPSAQRVVMTYDNARTTDYNESHWAHADALSADKANDPSVRKILRNRANYEVANNSYARGIVNTLAMDTVGTGPRLQIKTGDREQDKEIETAFIDWSDEVSLAEKLEVAAKCQSTEGEAFLHLIANPNLKSFAKFSLQEIPAFQIASNYEDALDPKNVDGVILNDQDEEIAFVVQDPDYYLGKSARVVSAENMIHLFEKFRAGQHRGIPEITPCLDLFGQLRRYTKAVLYAVEACANVSLVLQTKGVAPDEIAEVDALKAIKIQPNMLTTLPEGWELEQTDPTQPAATYPDFKREILGEAARPFSMPLSVALGSSAGMNYASGRLDVKSYQRRLKVRRKQIEIKALNKIVDLFLKFYFLSKGMPVPTDKIKRTYYWTEEEHVDPAKEANAAATLKKVGLETDASYYARHGQDWEEAYEQLREEKEKRLAYGIDTVETVDDDPGDQNGGFDDE